MLWISSEELYKEEKKQEWKKKEKEAFVKSFSWFLLILGLGLILSCQSWSQIRVSGLGRDSFGVDILCVSSSMFWTSLFDKFKLVCIFSSMRWTYWIFVRPYVGRIEYLLVHGLDVLNIYSSMGWMCLNPF